jgi:uncharacterized protein YbjT (DUF2867 family)
MSRVLITGANGHLGQRLIRALPESVEIVAAVRSARAAQSISPRRGLEVRLLDYSQPAQFSSALTDVDAVVHLVGILKETPDNSYSSAHEETCQALIDGAALARVKPAVVYISILGSSADQANACLASKGRAEDMLLNSGLPVTILQVPMVIGAGDYASHALKRRAMASLSVGLRMESREQPIHAGDVISAILASLQRSHGRLQLAGPESLSRRALVRRAAKVLGRQTTVLSLPFAVGATVAGIMEKLMSKPPVTRAMLEVLDHDDAINPAPATTRLGIQLTSLDEMLRQALQ